MILGSPGIRLVPSGVPSKKSSNAKIIVERTANLGAKLL